MNINLVHMGVYFGDPPPKMASVFLVVYLRWSPKQAQPGNPKANGSEAQILTRWEDFVECVT